MRANAKTRDMMMMMEFKIVRDVEWRKVGESRCLLRWVSICATVMLKRKVIESEATITSTVFDGRWSRRNSLESLERSNHWGE